MLCTDSVGDFSVHMHRIENQNEYIRPDVNISAQLGGKFNRHVIRSCVPRKLARVRQRGSATNAVKTSRCGS